jgi:glycolate oxidase FAD binding subunit
VSSIKASLLKLAERMRPDSGGMPEADLHAAPSTAEEVAELLAQASDHHLKVLVWGGGWHQGYGNRVEPDIVISTSRLNRIVDFQPDDLTVVAEAGVTLGDLDDKLATRDQTAVLPEMAGAATLGGVLAAGLSAYRRARYGPTRDRILEVTIVTGDGRIVRAGGRVVKNVTGYDLARLVVGSFGSLGVIISACLKLWPLPAARATVTLDDPERASLVYRPMAVLRDQVATRVYLAGTAEEVKTQVERLGGSVEESLAWPAPPSATFVWSLRFPPAMVSAALDRLRPDASYQAQTLVGEIMLGADNLDGMSDLRAWAESVGGSLVLVRAPAETYEVMDPWGKPPAALDLQRRLIASFDPARVINPGRLPGGI